MTPIETVQQIYGAFGRGDVPAMLALLADDVEWEYNHFPNPAPWLQPIRGRQNMPRFFEALAALEFTQFEPRHFFGHANLVVDVVDIAFTVKATGQRVIEPETVHLWHFNAEGLVSQFRHRVDTWQTALALKVG